LWHNDLAVLVELCRIRLDTKVDTSRSEIGSSVCSRQ